MRPIWPGAYSPIPVEQPTAPQTACPGVEENWALIIGRGRGDKSNSDNGIITPNNGFAFKRDGRSRSGWRDGRQTLFAFYMFVDLWRLFAHGQNGRHDLFSNHFASGVTPFIFGCHEIELSLGSREVELLSSWMPP